MPRVRAAKNKSTEIRLIALLRVAGITGWRRGALLPGKPDLIFRAAKLAVFVDGCFWHGCPRHGRTPKTRVAFWTAKLARNAQRDRAVSRALRASGWTVLRIWECALARSRACGMESRAMTFALVAKLRTWLRRICAGNGAERHRLPKAARRVAVATASNLGSAVRGGTGWSPGSGA